MSTIPKGTYPATLCGVKLIRKKDGEGWGLRLLARTDDLDRDVACWQALSSDSKDPYLLTREQGRSLSRFVERMGLPRDTLYERVPFECSRLLNEPVTVKVWHSPAGQHAEFSRDFAVQEIATVTTPARELSDAARSSARLAAVVGEDLPGLAFVAHKKILDGLSTARLGLSLCAEGCHAVFQRKAWEHLGYDSLTEYLASPEITLSRTDFYRMVDIWKSYVLEGGLDPAQLQTAGPSKLEVPLPALSAGTVTAEEALADASSLTRNDLRAKYSGEEPKPKEPKLCPHCGGEL